MLLFSQPLENEFSNANTGEGDLSGVWNLPLLRRGELESAVVLEFPNSERTQQYGTDKREHSAHRQHIEPQGKVHVTSSLDISCFKSSRVQVKF